MQLANATFISIKRKNFGKANSKMLFVLIAMLCCLGIMGIFLNWKTGLCSVSILTVAYFLLKNYILKITPVIFIMLLCVFVVYYFLNLDFLEILLTTLFLSVAFFLKPIYEATKENTDFELFFLDKETLKCLATKDNDYKGYGFNPKDFLKTYSKEKITSFTFHGKSLSIGIGSEIIRPKELTRKNLAEINLFLKQHFPDLLANESAYKKSVKAENKLYLNKFYVTSPIIILSAVIYFFGNDGRDTTVTYTCLLLMILLPIIIYRMVRQK